ncbi:bifunctional inositol-1 monophosphatase/fructose-1,6-bisphosphatase [Streptomyces malaysiensis subsp. malaysiensis]|uniref:Inorganic polyphosphate/ATP-NAD kinase n=1 Tax=Streptomyces malaysiensis TaxID=92644 RepID=A0A7X6B061_STRMQ|nr:bifunctional inositol-1 monophosphatase/fructose-1,6-bisphosphatase [Streptomyces sp. M56]NIY67927.1 inorganic polyphosphate/ATP-NAD kinase [Streptomyces malaysiensis]SCG13097.1 myo-inositol-1(or 4)-monophosphatase [Streptomyces sp. MnatMP-M27]
MQGVADRIWRAVRDDRTTRAGRYLEGTTAGGDAEFPVDVLAERVAWEYLVASGESVAVYTESEGLRVIGDDPRYVLVIDPIDGTRGAAADLEMACVSIAAARYGPAPSIADIEYAMLKEIKTGNWMYADVHSDGIESGGYPDPVPSVGKTDDLERMFWSLEFNGHPARLMLDAYGHLVDASANRGGVYVFNSASFSISRIITGQMDAYVDIGNRLLRDRPETEADFRRVGHGSILHLFPYDIAASVFLAERAGVVITDAYGAPLGDTLLLEIDPGNQRSCIAACTPRLHEALISEIRW